MQFSNNSADFFSLKIVLLCLVHRNIPLVKQVPFYLYSWNKMLALDNLCLWYRNISLFAFMLGRCEIRAGFTMSSGPHSLTILYKNFAPNIFKWTIIGCFFTLISNSRVKIIIKIEGYDEIFTTYPTVPVLFYIHLILVFIWMWTNGLLWLLYNIGLSAVKEISGLGP